MYSVYHPRCRAITFLLTRLCAIFVTCWLHASPLLRWISTEASSGSLAAIVVRIGGVSAALLGGVQAVSGATISFNGPFSTWGVAGDNFFFRLDITPVDTQEMKAFTATNLPPGITIRKQANNLGFLTGVPTQGGYWISTVTGWENPDATGASVSDTVEITILGGSSPPTITVHPASQRRLPGTNATFSVTASGTDPLTYHWLKGASPLLSATTATLTLTNLATNNAGAYSVIVSNSSGTATSSPSILSIASRPMIAPSLVGTAVRLGFAGETGVTYRVESASNVTATTWTTVTNLTPIQDGPLAVTNTPASSNLFYRLRLLGP